MSSKNKRGGVNRFLNKINVIYKQINEFIANFHFVNVLYDHTLATTIDTFTIQTLRWEI